MIIEQVKKDLKHAIELLNDCTNKNLIFLRLNLQSLLNILEKNSEAIGHEK